ncbi:hypothetical protein [Mobiluncus mulieris]|uniref:hypothetical protein n=1 Tax=Mobiluncus mulieris TaxID=2052 RepID=UPI0014702514|nr:hypothetical protein [Mobiluncus mulieris]NMX11124.1 hypothetical protein [Mobiluncus mulieris]
MRKLVTALTCALATLTLSGCTPLTTLDVDANGDISVYQEIIFNASDLKTLPEESRNCETIFRYYTENVEGEGLVLNPERVEQIDVPDAAKAGAIVCRFHLDTVSEMFKQVAKGAELTEEGDGMMAFSMSADLASSFREVIETNTELFGDAKKLHPYLMVRMPGKIRQGETRQTLAGMPGANDTDRWFSMDDLKGAIGVNSSIETAPKAVAPEPVEVAEPSKNTQPDSGVNLVTLGLLAGIMLVLAVIAVELFMFIHHRKRR